MFSVRCSSAAIGMKECHRQGAGFDRLTAGKLAKSRQEKAERQSRRKQIKHPPISQRTQISGELNEESRKEERTAAPRITRSSRISGGLGPRWRQGSRRVQFGWVRAAAVHCHPCRLASLWLAPAVARLRSLTPGSLQRLFSWIISV